MNFVIDESVDHAVTVALRNSGHSAWSVVEEESSIPDSMVFQRAIEHQAFLLTADKDFGDIIFRQKLANRGVILIRLGGLRPQEKAQRTLQVISKYGGQFEGTFTVITDQQVRIRKFNT